MQSPYALSNITADIKYNMSGNSTNSHKTFTERTPLYHTQHVLLSAPRHQGNMYQNDTPVTSFVTLHRPNECRLHVPAM